MFRKILVPLDGSTAAERALTYAIDLADRSQGEIVLTRVQASPGAVGFAVDLPIPQQAYAAEHRHCQAYLEDVRARLLSKGQTVRLETPEGDPSSAILEMAEKDGCDLIVISSHGRTGVGRFFLGSVAEKVTRHAHCPVLIARREASPR